MVQLHWVDWLFIVGYIVIAFGIGFYFSRRASKNIDEFFVAGRNLPWWIAGTSIVATTFAADTPLVIAGFIRSKGIYENWIWWNYLMGGMLCVFFYSRLWRRTGILTDVEFMELRYDGKPAAILRAFMAVYKGILANCITMGWVMLAMAKICEVMLGWPKVQSIAILLVIALLYTILSGFWGVVMTDLIQFVMAMTGSIALAGIVLWNMGGASGMVEQVSKAPGFTPKVFHMVPDLWTASELAIFTFIVMVTLKWWGGGEGNGYLAQRLFSTRSEKDSMLAALWFNFANYVLRPWPWIVVGLASIVFFPLDQLADPEKAYPLMIAKFLPVGLRGLMVASLLAAFMSTMDTHLNWGASYMVNDLYKRFVRQDADEKHYVFISRMAMVVLMGFAAFTAWQFQSIKGAWIYLMVMTAGVGFASLLRWYWWRINAWSEISALLASLVIANGFLFFQFLDWLGWMPREWMMEVNAFYSTEYFAYRLLVVIGACTAAWLIVTAMTRPVSTERLSEFYRKVRPGGWWGPIAERNPDVIPDRNSQNWPSWLAAVICVYTGLFGIGYMCLAQTVKGLFFLVISGGAAWFVISRVPSDEEERLSAEHQDALKGEGV